MINVNAMLTPEIVAQVESLEKQMAQLKKSGFTVGVAFTEQYDILRAALVDRGVIEE